MFYICQVFASHSTRDTWQQSEQDRLVKSVITVLYKDLLKNKQTKKHKLFCHMSVTHMKEYLIMCICTHIILSLRESLGLRLSWLGVMTGL